MLIIEIYFILTKDSCAVYNAFIRPMMAFISIMNKIHALVDSLTTVQKRFMTYF